MSDVVPSSRGQSLVTYHDHQPRRHLIHSQGLQRKPKRRKIPQPPQYRRDTAKIDKESGIGHEEQVGEGGEEDGHAAVSEDTGEEEVLSVSNTSGPLCCLSEGHRRRHVGTSRTYKEAHGKGELDYDQEELEELGGVLGEADHKVDNHAANQLCLLPKVSCDIVSNDLMIKVLTLQ